MLSISKTFSRFVWSHFRWSAFNIYWKAKTLSLFYPLATSANLCCWYVPWFQRRFIRREERWREGEERSEGEEKSPLVESVGNLTSMLSPSTEIEPRRWLAYILVTRIQYNTILYWQLPIGAFQWQYKMVLSLRRQSPKGEKRGPWERVWEKWCSVRKSTKKKGRGACPHKFRIVNEFSADATLASCQNSVNQSRNTKYVN